MPQIWFVRVFFANYDYLDGFQAENKQFWEGLFSKVKSENHEKVQNPNFCSHLAQVWFLWVSFANLDYLDGFQDNNRQFEEGLLLK